MQRLPRYEYLVSRIRARTSNLFDRQAYRAVLGSSTPFEAIFALKESRFRERLPSLAAIDYIGVARWLTADFPENLDFIKENAPDSLQAFLDELRDIFTAVYVSRLTASKRGVRPPLSQAVAVPSTRQLHTLGEAVGPEVLLQAFLDDQLRDQARQLTSFAAEEAKVFPFFSLPALAARNAQLRAESVDKREFSDLRPLLDAVSTGSMMVTLTSSRAEGIDAGHFEERFRSALGDLLTPGKAETVTSVSEAERLCWSRVASHARRCLIGYPFRARTVAGFLFLEWFDIVNWRLALLALQRVLTAVEADAAFIVA